MIPEVETSVTELQSQTEQAESVFIDTPRGVELVEIVENEELSCKSESDKSIDLDLREFSAAATISSPTLPEKTDDTATESYRDLLMLTTSLAHQEEVLASNSSKKAITDTKLYRPHTSDAEILLIFKFALSKQMCVKHEDLDIVRLIKKVKDVKQRRSRVSELMPFNYEKSDLKLKIA